jgi:hypothetical protein
MQVFFQVALWSWVVLLTQCTCILSNPWKFSLNILFFSCPHFSFLEFWSGIFIICYSIFCTSESIQILQLLIIVLVFKLFEHIFQMTFVFTKFVCLPFNILTIIHISSAYMLCFYNITLTSPYYIIVAFCFLYFHSFYTSTLHIWLVRCLQYLWESKFIASCFCW